MDSKLSNLKTETLDFETVGPLDGNKTKSNSRLPQCKIKIAVSRTTSLSYISLTTYYIQHSFINVNLIINDVLLYLNKLRISKTNKQIT